MIRKILIFTVLTVTAAAAVALPLWKSGAAQQPTSVGFQQGSARRTLPNFDIRQAGRGEFDDIDLNSTSGNQVAMQNARARSRASAVGQFRSSLAMEKAANLRAVINEAGGVKNFFIEGGTLSEPQSDTADNIARKFLERHGSLFAVSSRASKEELKLENEDNDRGTTFLNYTQTVGGLKVFEGQVQVVVNKNGEVLNVREGFLVDGPPIRRNGAMREANAIAKAFEHAGRNVFPSFVETHSRASTTEMSRFANPLDVNFEDVLSEQVVMNIGESRLAWHVYADVGPEEWYEIVLDAYTGELLLRHNLYVHQAQGTVYTEAPDKGPRQLVSFVGDTVINTAAGWMETSTVTTGNNVEAYLDTNADNVPDANNSTGLSNGHAFAANQNFTFPFSTTVDPRTQQPAVVTNLFYFNNIMHDFSYKLGFTETAGNFQVNNFGRGGIGNDSVQAEAQDGSGTDNANFATPPDGSRPRMQQYLFVNPNPDRDSSVDGDVVFHEYGHGISNRLIGNGSTALTGLQSGAMGEGWSDYWAVTINDDGAVGEYVTNNPAGIRRAAYTVPAAAVHDSYADVGAGGFEVHNDGEVWAATLWDLRTQLGAAITDRIVLNGMRFTPTRPSFLNARDGIIQADQNLNGGANRCAIWAVFARHGMGVSAVGNDGTTHVAATDVPADCGGTCSFSISPTSAGFAAAGGTGTVTVTTQAGCNWTAVSNNSFTTITSSASGSGSGTVNYSVAANTTTTARSGSLTIAGLTHSVSQAAGTNTCSFSISPTSAGFAAAGGPASVTVTTQAGCNWTAASNNSFITVTSGASGSGSGTVTYAVAANTSTTARSGSLTIAGLTHSVSQDAGGTCSFSINPTSASFAAAGGTGSVTVTTQAGCNWTGASNNAFITITSGASGSGSGTVTYAVAANTSTTARSGSLTIAGLTHSVSQDAGGTCSFSINPTSASFPAEGGTGSVTVTTQAGCNWTAVSNNAFITITSGASGSGSGTVNYSVAARILSTPRNGSLTIAGLTHSVSEDGGGDPSCRTCLIPLGGEALSTNFIRLTWLGNGDDGVSIDRWLEFNFSFIARTDVQVGPKTTTFNDRNLTRDTWYSYPVSAFNGTGNSAYSNVISIKTPL